MSRPDLSVIVTAHSETVVAGPTMASAATAILNAEADGVSVEKIIVLDRPTDDCSTFFNQPEFDDWKRVISEEGDLGRTRNFVLPISTGANIAYLDADDLFSENWLVEAMRCIRDASQKRENVIVHPELNWLFDGAGSVLANPAQDHPHFLPEYFYIRNYYDSLCLSPREAHEQSPYVSRDIPNGLSFQDWQYSVETMAAGWNHVIALNTIIFKRRRDSSLVTESSGRQSILRSLDCLAIDRVKNLPHSKPAKSTPGV